MMRTRRLLLIVLVLAGLGALPAVAAPDARSGPCVDHTGPTPFAVGGEGGFVAYPDRPPRGLVVFFHGIDHTAADWARYHLERVADESDVVTVAMDYPGDRDEHGGQIPGAWPVQEGARVSIAAAEALQARCPTVRTTVAYGVSMGGNSSGLALADAPVGLFDWWFAVEGAHNVIETYLEASAVALARNETAMEAQAGIEREMGGTLAEKPEAYRQRTNVLRAEEIAASGIKGVFMVHGVADGLVPYDQSREMAGLLRALGRPVEFVTATTRGEGEPGTTIDGYAWTAAGATPNPSPFAGHANENSTTHVVGAAGFARLRELLAGDLIEVDSEQAIP